MRFRGKTLLVTALVLLASLTSGVTSAFAEDPPSVPEEVFSTSFESTPTAGFSNGYFPDPYSSDSSKPSGITCNIVIFPLV